MFTETLLHLFIRDLNRLKKEILAYEDEAKLWVVEKEVNNSAGNLCLHLCGNLQHFIGATLGNTGYKRDRPGEFANKNVPVAEMETDIDNTISALQQTVNSQLFAASIKQDLEEIQVQASMLRKLNQYGAGRETLLALDNTFKKLDAMEQGIIQLGSQIVDNSLHDYTQLNYDFYRMLAMWRNFFKDLQAPKPRITINKTALIAAMAPSCSRRKFLRRFGR